MTPSQITAKLAKQGLEKSHWGLRIIAATQRLGFSEQDEQDASNWITCACGKIDGALVGISGPNDDILFSDGNKFFDAVRDDRFEDAVRYLVAVQLRAALLLEHWSITNSTDEFQL